MKTNTINTKALFEQYESISLRKLSAALNLNYQMMLKVQKKPIEGEVYDPTAINHDALDEYINSRIEPDTVAAIDFEQLNAESVTINAKGFEDFKVGEVITMRGSETKYEIVYLTADHICIKEAAGTKLRTMNGHTFIHQTPRKVDDVAATATSKEDK